MYTELKNFYRPCYHSAQELQFLEHLLDSLVGLDRDLVTLKAQLKLLLPRQGLTFLSFDIKPQAPVRLG